MSTIVCQNLVSCFDTETITTTLRLKVAPPLPPPPATVDFYKILSNDSNHHDQTKISPYNHNMTNKNPFFSNLSAESLDLCTENLGSESGSDVVSGDTTVFSDTDSSSSSSSQSNYEHEKSKQRTKSHKSENNLVYPPPLSSMSSSQVLRRRTEGGRLIIEAVEAPYGNSHLQAERSDGRLRLCFMNNNNNNNANGRGEQVEDDYEEDECDDEEELDQEMEMEKFERLNRCHNSGINEVFGGSNWKSPLWVASS